MDEIIRHAQAAASLLHQKGFHVDAEAVEALIAEAAGEITASERAALARESYEAVVRAETETVERCIAIVKEMWWGYRLDEVESRLRSHLRAVSPTTDPPHGAAAEHAAQLRYQQAIEAGLSDAEAREEGWPK